MHELGNKMHKIRSLGSLRCSPILPSRLERVHQDTEFHRYRVIHGWDIAIKPISIWRPSAILNLQNFDFLARIHSCNQNLHQYTKVYQNQIVYGWVLAIKGFSNGGHPPYWTCCDAIILHRVKFSSRLVYYFLRYSDFCVSAFWLEIAYFGPKFDMLGGK